MGKKQKAIRFKVTVNRFEAEVNAANKEDAIATVLDSLKRLPLIEVEHILPGPSVDGKSNYDETTCPFCRKEHTPEYLSSMAFREDHNLWDRDGLSAVFDTIKNEDWCWTRSDGCKYLVLRIDMRDGAGIIMNREGKRISPRQLKWQYSAATPDSIKDEEAYKDEDTETT